MKDFYDVEYGEEVYIDEDGNEYRLLRDEYGQEVLQKLGDLAKGAGERIFSVFKRGGGEGGTVERTEGKIDGAVGAADHEPERRHWGDRETGPGHSEDVDAEHMVNADSQDLQRALNISSEEAEGLLSSIVSFVKGNPVKSSLGGLVALGGPAVVTLMKHGGKCKDVLRNFFKGKATVQEVKQAAAADGFLYRNGKWIAAGAGTLAVGGAGAYAIHRRHDKRR